MSHDRMRPIRRVAAGSLTLLALLAQPAAARAAEEGNTCSLYQEASPTQLLRRLSLDLRNRLPAYEEYLAVEEAGALPPEVLDDYLGSDEFRLAMRRFHEALLWPNVGNVRLSLGTHSLKADPDTGIHYITNKQDKFRGGDGTHICRNVKQTEFQNGMPVTKTIQAPGGAYQADGWVEVTPYWAPGEKVKVCAFDAQDALQANGNACDALAGAGEKACGCGPNLRFCYGPAVHNEVRADMREQLLRTVDDSTTGGRPYSELITTRTAHVSGKLAYWQKHLAHVNRIKKIYARHHAGDTPLEEAPKYTDDWKTVERTEAHSGVLTLPAFTLRFQTNRGRANRFRTAFEGKYFEPPSVNDSGCDPDHGDVTQRCVCRHCHMELEPLAAHFAPFAEAGTSLISAFEPYRKDCIQPNADPESRCGRFYVTDPKAHRAGWLLALQYADDETDVHQAIAAGAEAGVGALAEDAVASGAFARATVVHLFEHFMGHAPDLDPASEHGDGATIEALAAELQSTDDFRLAVKAIVSLPAYRRMR